MATKRIPVSLYFVPEWWDRHYHSAEPRPAKRSQTALESMYTGRQRFLHERFGDFGIGQAQPALAGSQIATVIRHTFDLLPVLLGTQVDVRDAWGFYPRHRRLSELAALAPVDVARHPEGEWIARQRTLIEALYGPPTQNIDIGSVSNNAFRIIGEELYAALLCDRERLCALFEVIIATEQSLHKFLSELFAPLDPVPISNCNANMMGSGLYQTCVLPFDARQNRFAEALTGAEPRANVHHCDVIVDQFVHVYAKLPRVAMLQASLKSDIAMAKRALPGSSFSAMIGPSSMDAPPETLQHLLESALEAGADDFPVWNIDPALDVSRTRDMLEAIRAACRASGCEAQFAAMPLCWEELEWAHGRYGSP